MKIVHIITRLIRAGADENTVLTCVSQAKEGHDVVLVHGREFDPSYHSWLPQEGVRLIELEPLVRKMSPLHDMKALFQLRALLKELSADIVHTHTSKAGILGRIAAYLARTKLIVHGVHIVPFVNGGWFERQIYLLAEHITSQFTHAFIDVSQGVRDIYLKYGVGRPDRHHVIHSGFDLSKFKNASYPNDWRQILGIGMTAEKPPVVIILGALEPRKRQAEFIAAFGRVLERTPNARLLVLGEGSQAAKLRQQVHDLNLTENVKLIGFREDPEKMIALSDLCVLTSSHEGLPRVVMQYLAGGRPCVVSELPGLDEVVKHGVNGMVIPSADVPAAADAVGMLLSDQEMLARLARGARETDLSNWAATTMCMRIANVYEALAGDQDFNPVRQQRSALS